MQFFLEGYQWHGVKRGDAFAFYAGDITVEGPHPFCSSGGNLGAGALPYGHVHRQHRAAPRHSRRAAGQGSGRDRAGSIRHAKTVAAGSCSTNPRTHDLMTLEVTGSRRPTSQSLTQKWVAREC